MKVARIGLVAFALVLLAGACWLLAVPDPPRIASRDESLVTAPPKPERGEAVVAAEPEPTGFDERESIAGEEVAESPAASSPPAPTHPTTSLLGTVVDAVDRAPRRGQRVELGCPVIADFDPVTAVSDDRGEFRAEGLPIRRTLYARFEMEGGERWIQRFELRESGESRRTFELSPAASVAGRVVDAVSWNPLVGATVRIEHFQTTQRGGVEAECMSAADGSFALAVPADLRDTGIVTLVVTREHHLPTRLQLKSGAATTGLEVPSMQGAVLEVALVNGAGEPRSGNVRMEYREPPRIERDGRSIDVVIGASIEHAKVANDGIAKILAAPGHEVVVSADAAAVPRSAETTLVLGDARSITRHRIVLAEFVAARVAGVLSFNGKPGPIPFRLGGTHAQRQGKADAAGAYAIEDLPPGNYSFSASIPGLTTRKADLDLAPGADLRHDVDIVTAMSRIGGVVMQDGLPVAAFPVFLRDPHGEFRVPVGTDSDGRFVTNVPFAAGTELFARLDVGFGFVESVIRAGAEDHVLELPPTYFLRVHPIDAETKRPLAVTPYLRIGPQGAESLRSILRASGTMREDGIVEIEVPPGTFDLELSLDPRWRTTVKVSLVANPDPPPVTVHVPRPRLGTVVVERVEEGGPDGDASEAADVLEVVGATLHFAAGDNVFWAATEHEQRKLSATETEYRLPVGRLEIAFGNQLLLPRARAVRRVIELEENAIVRIRIRVRAAK
jgi:hypothetical protein